MEINEKTAYFCYIYEILHTLFLRESVDKSTFYEVLLITP